MMESKKTALNVIVLVCAVCITAAGCFLINRASREKYSDLYDTATFDIDGDGVKEVCSLTYGPTSGVFSAIFSVREVGKMNNEYQKVFASLNLYYADLSFVKGKDGAYKVKAVTQGDKPETHLFDVSVKDNTVCLEENGVTFSEIQSVK